MDKVEPWEFWNKCHLMSSIINIYIHNYISITLEKPVPIFFSGGSPTSAAASSVLAPFLRHALSDVETSGAPHNMKQFTGLVEGQIYRKPCFFMFFPVKYQGGPVNCPLNQSKETWIKLEKGTIWFLHILGFTTWYNLVKTSSSKLIIPNQSIPGHPYLAIWVKTCKGPCSSHQNSQDFGNVFSSSL